MFYNTHAKMTLKFGSFDSSRGIFLFASLKNNRKSFRVECQLGALITCIKCQLGALITFQATRPRSCCEQWTKHLFTFLGHELLFPRFISIWTLWQVHRNSRNKSSWFVAAMTFILLSMKSEVDESVLCIISDVFVAVEVCTTAK